MEAVWANIVPRELDGPAALGGGHVEGVADLVQAHARVTFAHLPHGGQGGESGRIFREEEVGGGDFTKVGVVEADRHVPGVRLLRSGEGFRVVHVHHDGVGVRVVLVLSRDGDGLGAEVLELNGHEAGEQIEACSTVLAWRHHDERRIIVVDVVHEALDVVDVGLAALEVERSKVTEVHTRRVVDRGDLEHNGLVCGLHTVACA